MTTYRYWGPFVYRNAELEHFYHAEGKARWIAQDSKFEYDYFVKDHLGNVRSVVTPEIAPPLIYVATHEMPAATVEEEIFENIEAVRGERPGGGSPLDIAAAILNGGNDSTRIGTALLLRTMAGDKVKLKVSAFFASAGDSTMNVQASSSQMLSALLGTLGGTGAVGGSGEGGGSTGLLGNLLTEGNYTGIYDAIKESVTNSAFPRAYLNWIAFDGNMRLVASQSGAIQVGAGSTDAWESLEPGELTMAKSGYLVVYLSNEAYMDVAFDQLSVTHYRGKLLQEQHYYPHGLVIDGVVAPGAQPTREKYQGKELQDELGLELYDFHARQYDPQPGRFWGRDPTDQFPGGYTGMGNDPANMVDPNGMQAGVAVGGGSSIPNTITVDLDTKIRDIDMWMFSNFKHQQELETAGIAFGLSSSQGSGFGYNAVTNQWGHWSQRTVLTPGTGEDHIWFTTTVYTHFTPLSLYDWMEVKRSSETDYLGATSIAMDVMSNTALPVIEYGFASAAKSAPSAAIFKKGATAMKAIGGVLSVAQIGISTYNGVKQGWTRANKIDLWAGAAGLMPVVGQTWGVVWFCGNMIS